MNHQVRGTIDTHAPRLPGVYIITSDVLEKCVYVGRAQDIQHRLLQHYTGESRESTIINRCHPNRFRYIVLPTHRERVLFEHLLKKGLHPLYDRVMEKLSS